MKLKRGWMMLPLAALIGLSADAGAQGLAAREKLANAVVKQKLAKLRGDIAKNKRRYKVGYTSAMDQKLSDLARTVPPPDLPQVAAAQNAKATELARKFPNLVKKVGTCDVKAQAFDWRTAGKMTPIRNQASCGSCWSFTGAAVYESSYALRTGKAMDLSEQHILDCAKTRAGKDAGTCGGGWFAGVFDTLVDSGGAAESSMPYAGSSSACKAGVATPYRAVTWGYVKNDGSAPSVAEMKTALCQHGALASTVYVTDAFMAYAGGIFDEQPATKGPKDVNHAITLVGWDDGKGAYLIKNSWTTGWGEAGYMWIAYNSSNVGYGTSWVDAKGE